MAKDDEASPGCCDHWGKGLKNSGYFTSTEGLIHDVILLGDNSSGLFLSSVYINPALHFANS